MVYDAMEQAEQTATQNLTHKWFASDSVVQDIVNYAYQLWGMDFVYVLECENGSYRLNSVGDWGHAHGLCQMNDRYHKDIPADYETDWKVAVEYCYKKWSSWTVFYWPQRIVKWKKCYKYVADRFILE